MERVQAQEKSKVQKKTQVKSDPESKYMLMGLVFAILIFGALYFYIYVAS